MKLSVTIPVYNGMPFVKDAVNSVLSEQGVDLELVIVDNCSTDETWPYLSQIDDPRVRVFRNEINLGMRGNWNRVLELVEGDLVKILCADDTVMPGTLGEQVSLLSRPGNETVSLVAGKREVVGPSGKTVLSSHGLSRLRGKVPGRTALRHTILAGTNIFGEPSAVMFRREAAKEAGGFQSPDTFLLDLHFYSELLGQGDLYAQQTVVARFRVSGNSESTSLGRTQARQMRRFISLMYKQRRIPIWVAWVGNIRAEVNAVARRILYRRLLE